METTELTLKSLHLLSPGLADDFQQQREAAVMDCKQRPSLAAKRELQIRLTVTPHPECGAPRPFLQAGQGVPVPSPGYGTDSALCPAFFVLGPMRAASLPSWRRASSDAPRALSGRGYSAGSGRFFFCVFRLETVHWASGGLGPIFTHASARVAACALRRR